MEKKIQEAARLHQQGFNCAQAVALPFCEELGMDRAAAMRALEGFGAGMGGRTMACGALSGAVFVAGLKHSDGNLEAPASKQRTYEQGDLRRVCGALRRFGVRGYFGAENGNAADRLPRLHRARCSAGVSDPRRINNGRIKRGRRLSPTSFFCYSFSAFGR